MEKTMSPDIPRRNRHSIRYDGYDYRSAGAYFVTICIQHRLPLLGEFQQGKICLTAAGKMVMACWFELPNRFPTVALDAFQIMPNHLHFVLWIEHHNREITEVPSLGSVVGAFKSITTAHYVRGVRSDGWAPFSKRLWQRNYWERIVRTESELQRIRAYIDANFGMTA
jgi:putative transposase